MTDPRSREGSKYHQIGSEAYAVVIAGGREISERHSGTMWISLVPDAGVRFLFVDDQGHTTSRFTPTEGATSAVVGIYVDGDHVVSSAPARVYRGGLVELDWSEMYAGMR